MPFKKGRSRLWQMITDEELDAIEARHDAALDVERRAEAERLKRATPSPFPEMVSWLDRAA